MSMYPSPYQSPGVPQYYSAPVDPLAPAKRASLMMFIVGPLILLSGTCLMSVPSMMRMTPSPELDQMRRRFQEQSHVNLDIIMGVTGGLALVVGLTILILAFFVRRGSKASSLAAAVVTGLLTLYSVLNVVGCLVMVNIPGVCMSVLMAAVFGLMLYWLVQAIRSAGNASLAQQQYAAQYWHYQQTMQAHANAGYGYGYGAPSQPEAPLQTPPAIAPQPQVPQVHSNPSADV